MKEKVVEILMYLMSEMQDSKGLSEVDMDELHNRGYTQSEISAAFSWLTDNMQSVNDGGSRSVQTTAGSHRVFHEAEKLVLSTEARGYVIHLRELGLLTDGDVETIIERSMMSGYEKLSVSEVRSIIASVLFSRVPASGTHRAMLSSEDTVN